MTAVVAFETRYRNGKAVDYVCIAPKGEAFMKTQTWYPVSKIKPRDDVDEEVKGSLTYQAMAGRWTIVGPKYEQWKLGNEIPEEGTPLGAWSSVTPEIATILKQKGIRTVEDVADMSPDAASKLPMPNARKLPELAKAYLGGVESATLAEENESLKERMAAMEEMIAQLSEGKRGPGRPKKEAIDA